MALLRHFYHIHRFHIIICVSAKIYRVADNFDRSDIFFLVFPLEKLAQKEWSRGQPKPFENRLSGKWNLVHVKQDLWFCAVKVVAALLWNFLDFNLTLSKTKEKY
jgi:hypothetical protein